MRNIAKYSAFFIDNIRPQSYNKGVIENLFQGEVEVLTGGNR